MKKLLYFGFALCVVIFVINLVRLFSWRFTVGDIYPPGSTLRADPQGAKAFFDSLNRCRGLRISRNFRDLDQATEGEGVTWFWLGAAPRNLRLPSSKLVNSWEFLANRGARVVFAFSTAEEKFDTDFTSLANPSTNDVSVERENKTGQTGSETEKNKRFTVNPSRLKGKTNKPVGLSLPVIRRTALAQRWGIDFAYRPLPITQAPPSPPLRAQRLANSALPEHIPWHSGWHFTGLHSAWRVVYSCNQQPVLVERPWGKGSLVFCADSWLLSNEALRQQRHPELLAWLLGSHRQAVFDESHLGVKEQPGVATLMRQYRLYPIGLVLLLLAGLYIWKNIRPLTPSTNTETDEATEIVTGKDTSEGFLNLLRRHLPADRLMAECLAEWGKSIRHTRPDLANKLGSLVKLAAEDAAKPARQRDPVALYRHLSQIVSRRANRTMGKSV